MKTLALMLISLPAIATNFAFVQITHGTGSATFGSSNGAGHIIVAFVMSGSSPAVTDSQSNTYTFQLAGTGSFAGEIQVFTATHIAAGSNTVTTTSGDVVAVEYSSAAGTYYVCPGHASASVGTDAGTISNQQVNHTTGSFNSPTEVEAVFGGWENGTAHNCSINTGTIRLNGITPMPGNAGYCTGDDNQSSMTGVYANTPFYIEPLPSYPSASLDIFLSLTNCAGGGAQIRHRVAMN